LSCDQVIDNRFAFHGPPDARISWHPFSICQVLYGLKNMCAKFDAFTRFVTIFPLTDRTKCGFSRHVSLAQRTSRVASTGFDSQRGNYHYYYYYYNYYYYYYYYYYYHYYYYYFIFFTSLMRVFSEINKYQRKKMSTSAFRLG